MTFDGLDVLLILTLHLLGDFVLQSQKMALNKSKSSKWLGAHVGVYTLCLLPLGPAYAAVNGALHFATDFVTSRITSWLYRENRIHEFFLIIGCDQYIHVVTLLATFWILNQ